MIETCFYLAGILTTVIVRELAAEARERWLERRIRNQATVIEQLLNERLNRLEADVNAQQTRERHLRMVSMADDGHPHH